MELRDYIEQAAEKAGSVSALARMLGMNQPDVSNAKAMKKRLPAIAVVQLADYINADLKAVIAANELVTEKDEKKRAFWSPFVQHAKAASIALAIAVGANFVTPTPAEATESLDSHQGTVCIMLSRHAKRIIKKLQLHRLLEDFIEAIIATIQMRRLQV